MAEMVDRCALALCNISINTHGDAHLLSLSALDPEAQRQFRLMAKTVIEAMRVPTPAMIEAGTITFSPKQSRSTLTVNGLGVWENMIDEALK